MVKESLVAVLLKLEEKYREWYRLVIMADGSGDILDPADEVTYRFGTLEELLEHLEIKP